MKSLKQTIPSLVVNGLSIWSLVYLSLAYLEPGKKSFFLKILVSALAGIAIMSRSILKTFQVLSTKSESGKQKENTRNEAKYSDDNGQ